MIFNENITINGKEFIRTYSDSYMVMRDGIEYEEAIDPAEFDRKYTESATPLPELSAEEALEVITGGAV